MVDKANSATTLEEKHKQLEAIFKYMVDNTVEIFLGQVPALFASGARVASWDPGNLPNKMNLNRVVFK